MVTPNLVIAPGEKEAVELAKPPTHHENNGPAPVG
jgi:hypothetical protein